MVGVVDVTSTIPVDLLCSVESIPPLYIEN